ncbi:hypothetical protein [Acidithiobacillus thiooxidans]|uniref:hypothetical protein n=1 Tax=Acidithiobacillus thiooxidans TaxID=930 RepID=UPI003561AACF|nr:hypothetical protein [Acidithiobacillus sp.]
MSRISLVPLVRKHPFWSVLGVLLFAVGAFLLAYLPVRYGSAYSAAKTIVMQSAYIHSMVGPDPKVSLPWFNAGSEKLILGGSGHSRATLRVDVRGAYGHLTLHLHMKKIAGVWRINSSTVGGKPVLLGASTGSQGYVS